MAFKQSDRDVVKALARQIGVSEIGGKYDQAGNVIRISLSNCHLTRLPLEVVRLRHLQHLSLHYNQLCELPSEIGQLTHLQSLDVSHNHFPVLPPQVKPLRQHCFIRNEVSPGPGWERLQQAIDRIADLHATHTSGEPTYRYLVDPPGQALAELYKQLHPDAGGLTLVVYALVRLAPPSIASTLLEHIGDAGAHQQEDIEQKTERCLHLLRATTSCI